MYCIYVVYLVYVVHMIDDLAPLSNNYCGRSFIIKGGGGIQKKNK